MRFCLNVLTVADGRQPGTETKSRRARRLFARVFVDLRAILWYNDTVKRHKNGGRAVYTAFSVVIFVFLAAIAASYVPLATRRWVIARLVMSALVGTAGVVCALAARLRFGSIEEYNEWATDAFASFINPLEIMAALGVVILAACVLTARSRAKTVVCLSAAAAFALFILLYTALFALMTENTVHPVNTYIRVCGGGSAAVFAVVGAIADARRLAVHKR